MARRRVARRRRSRRGLAGPGELSDKQLAEEHRTEALKLLESAQRTFRKVREQAARGDCPDAVEEMYAAAGMAGRASAQLRNALGFWEARAPQRDLERAEDTTITTLRRACRVTKA